jgi:Trk K+ transport system NAD-binding subunit
MKNFMSLLLSVVGGGTSRRNILTLVRFLMVLAGLITIYSVVFHFIMQWEGQKYSWITGFYWTLTVMSTLGFGDITFHTDLGRIFSIVVLLTGMVFMLTLLPFTFIQFFWAPWMEAQSALRFPRELPEDSSGHVVLTHNDEVARTLIRKLEQYKYPYVLLMPTAAEAAGPQDEGFNVAVGDLDDPLTYRNLRLEKSALLAATSTDIANTGVVSVARGVSETVKIVATVKDEDSIDILGLAGADNVLHLGDMTGEALARRVIAGDTASQIIGSFDDLNVAEAIAANTPLVGTTLAESRIRESVGINVVGLWERGEFKPAGADAMVTRNTVLVLAGSRQQLEEYDRRFTIQSGSDAPVVIIGGGRVGRATGRALERREVDYRIIEKDASRIPDSGKYVHGSAADLDILKKAGIMECSGVVVTSHDDDLNVYLTIYCRKLRPNVQIVTRATRERIVGTLHRAGADFVMSYASLGANTIFNLLQRSDIVMVAEGLSLIRMETPARMVGRTLAEMEVRKETGCTVVAFQYNGSTEINPSPDSRLPENSEIILIGGIEAEQDFLETFAHD